MADFQREDRYITFKLKHLSQHHVDALNSLDAPHVAGVFVEHDWPEYELVWQMIERGRAGETGASDQVAENQRLREALDTAIQWLEHYECDVEASEVRAQAALSPNQESK